MLLKFINVILENCKEKCIRDFEPLKKVSFILLVSTYFIFDLYIHIPANRSQNGIGNIVPFFYSLAHLLLLN